METNRFDDLLYDQLHLCYVDENALKATRSHISAMVRTDITSADRVLTLRAAFMTAETIESPRGRILAGSFLESAAALLASERGNIHEARTRLKNSFKLDGCLSVSEDLSIIKYHQIQTLHNYARLFRVSGQNVASTSLIVRIVEGLSVGTVRCNSSLNMEAIKGLFDRQLNLEMQLQVLSDLPQIYSDSARGHLSHIRKIISRSSLANSLRDLRVDLARQWLNLKSDERQSDQNKIFLICEVLLTERPNNPMMILWDDLFLDYVDLIKGQNLVHAMNSLARLKAIVSQKGGSSRWINRRLGAMEVEIWSRIT